MVKLTTTALISILALATLGLSAPSSHTHIQRNEDTIAQIKADVTDISTKLTTLSANVDVFPTSGGSLINALVRLRAQCFVIACVDLFIGYKQRSSEHRERVGKVCC